MKPLPSSLEEAKMFTDKRKTLHEKWKSFISLCINYRTWTHVHNQNGTRIFWFRFVILAIPSIWYSVTTDCKCAGSGDNRERMLAISCAILWKTRKTSKNIYGCFQHQFVYMDIAVGHDKIGRLLIEVCVNSMFMLLHNIIHVGPQMYML